MTYSTSPINRDVLMAFFIGASSQTVGTNQLVDWYKLKGSTSITASSGTITLPAGYVWAITTQILLAQDATREFIFWDGSAEYSGSQRLGITAGDTGSRIAFNILSTETGSLTFAWRNTQASYTITSLNTGMQIIGVPK